MKSSNEPGQKQRLTVGRTLLDKFNVANSLRKNHKFGGCKMFTQMPQDVLGWGIVGTKNLIADAGQPLFLQQIVTQDCTARVEADDRSLKAIRIVAEQRPDLNRVWFRTITAKPSQMLATPSTARLQPWRTRRPRSGQPSTGSSSAGLHAKRRRATTDTESYASGQRVKIAPHRTL